ncbi:MAG: selenocysteine-specific translation elongation factor [Rhodospirillaceae bacterium]|nr:selenocysteine-specific translation elongation factor [Rhodospirillaceae bacterium]
MIIATAGHVDHGKTTLIQALTGIDTDRLPEEKARGLSIDLGYAYSELSDGSLVGFVDVPGHARFIGNMLAGVAGIDAGLLVVAVDDGPMPQTLEHLAILDLLGVNQGVVALTKTDRAPPERIAEVMTETQALLAPTSLSGAQIIETAALAGIGITELDQALQSLEPSESRDEGAFRLAVDRVFTLRGVGLIATGTVFSGRLKVGDELLISPAGLPVAARGLHAQNRPAETAGTGTRCAINLVGRHAGEKNLKRGDWLVGEDAHLPSNRIDALVQLAIGEDDPIRHDTPVHVHIGAADIPGRIALLESRRLSPGETALAQLVLDREVTCVHGDRLILRDQTARRTLAGGRVIDPLGAVRGRARPERRAWLLAMAETEPATALSRLLAETSDPVALDLFWRRRNTTQKALSTHLVDLNMVQADGYAISPNHWQAWREAVPVALARVHAEAPDRIGLDLRELRHTANLPEAMARPLLAELMTEGAIVFRFGAYRLPGHQPKPTVADAALWAEVLPHLGDRDHPAPVLHEIAKVLDREPSELLSILERVGRLGLAIRVSRNRFLLPETTIALARAVDELAAVKGTDGFTVADFRDFAGIGRNLAIEVLEFLDRQRMTRRNGAVRTIVMSADRVFGSIET